MIWGLSYLSFGAFTMAWSPNYGGEYWTKMLLDRTIRCIISNLSVYYLMVLGMLLRRTL